jgi:hypothetical protein
VVVKRIHLPIQRLDTWFLYVPQRLDMKSIFRIADGFEKTIVPSKQEIDLQCFAEHQKRKPCVEVLANEMANILSMGYSTTQPHTSHYLHAHETLVSTDLWHI